MDPVETAPFQKKNSPVKKMAAYFYLQPAFLIILVGINFLSGIIISDFIPAS
jgi:hypothetical protein